MALDSPHIKTYKINFEALAAIFSWTYNRFKFITLKYPVISYLFASTIKEMPSELFFSSVPIHISQLIIYLGKFTTPKNVETEPKMNIIISCHVNTSMALEPEN